MLRMRSLPWRAAMCIVLSQPLPWVDPGRMWASSAGCGETDGRRGAMVLLECGSREVESIGVNGEIS